MPGTCGRLTERATPQLNAEQLTFESSFQESATNTGSCNRWSGEVRFPLWNDWPLRPGDHRARTTLMLFYWLTESVVNSFGPGEAHSARHYGRKHRAHHRPHRFSADPFDVTL